MVGGRGVVQFLKIAFTFTTGEAFKSFRDPGGVIENREVAGRDARTNAICKCNICVNTGAAAATACDRDARSRITVLGYAGRRTIRREGYHTILLLLLYNIVVRTCMMEINL